MEKSNRLLVALLGGFIMVFGATAAVLLGARRDQGAGPGANAGDRRPGSGPVRVLPEPVRIVAEAEGGVVEAPFEVREDPAASGGKCVLLAEKWATHEELHPAFKTRDGTPVSKKGLEDNPLGRELVPNGQVELRFEVKKAAEYALWVRANFHCSCGNSVFVSINQPPPVDTDGDGRYDKNPPDLVAGSTYGKWLWFRLTARNFRLEAGEQVLRLMPREDGIKVDQVLLAEVDPELGEYVPQGMEEPRP